LREKSGQKSNDDTAAVVSSSLAVLSRSRQETSDSTIIMLSFVVEEAEQTTNDFTSRIPTSGGAETKQKPADNPYHEAGAGLDENSVLPGSVKVVSNIVQPVEAKLGPKPNADTTAFCKQMKSTRAWNPPSEAEPAHKPID
jgi:hypothetical protein